MNKFHSFDKLNQNQIEQYRKAVAAAFPAIIQCSEVSKSYWPRLEAYFPFAQRFLIGMNGNLIGFINAIPFFWNKPLSELPDEGWDWMLAKGIQDHEQNIKPNSLGGLQIIVTKENQGKGISKLIIQEAKRLVKKQNYSYFILPIRPTFKPHHPEMNMAEYINLKQDEKIFDPWIRTHLNSGAQIISICHNSMNIAGDLKFWEQLMPHVPNKSGYQIVEGALNPVHIDIENNYGEYREDNIWIYYS